MPFLPVLGKVFISAARAAHSFNSLDNNTPSDHTRTELLRLENWRYRWTCFWGALGPLLRKRNMRYKYRGQVRQHEKVCPCWNHQCRLAESARHSLIRWTTLAYPPCSIRAPSFAETGRGRKWECKSWVKGIVNIPGEIARGYTLPENSRNRKQEKMMNIVLWTASESRSILKTVPLEFTLYQ